MIRYIKIFILRIYSFLIFISLKYKLRNKRIFIEFGVDIDNSSEFEDSIYVKTKSNIKSSYIGFGTYIGHSCYLEGAKIGRFCSIADHVNIILNDHPTQLYVSTHPAFHRGNHPLMKLLNLAFNKDDIYISNKYVSDQYKIEIGSDVWIGFDVKILAGVKIGSGAIIGAGSVITKDVEPYSIVGGVPAKVIKYRFDDYIINKLLSIKWWDWDYSKIIENQKKFKSINQFLDCTNDGDDFQ